jgi:hypothetical protein
MAASVRRTLSRAAVGGTCLAAALAVTPVASAQPAAPRATAHWSIVKTVKQAGYELEDVVAFRSGRAWISGGHGSPYATPFLLHRVGTKWTMVSRPGIEATNVFGNNLSATSDTNVWMSIANGAAVDGWNGSWFRQSFGTPGTVAVGGVAAVGPHSVWVFTHDFNASTESVWFGGIGQKFIGAPFPATIDSCSPVNAVSASSGSNIWGWAITPSHVWEAVHWNGATWTEVKVPAALLGGTSGCPGQILAESPKNVWGP